MVSGPRIPSLVIGLLLCVVGGAYLLDSGPAGPTALALLLVGLGAAALLALLRLRTGGMDASGDDTSPPGAQAPGGDVSDGST